MSIQSFLLINSIISLFCIWTLFFINVNYKKSLKHDSPLQQFKRLSLQRKSGLQHIATMNVYLIIFIILQKINPINMAGFLYFFTIYLLPFTSALMVTFYMKKMLALKSEFDPSHSAKEALKFQAIELLKVLWPSIGFLIYWVFVSLGFFSPNE